MTEGNLAQVMKPPLIDKQESNRTPNRNKESESDDIGTKNGAGGTSLRHCLWCFSGTTGAPAIDQKK